MSCASLNMATAARLTEGYNFASESHATRCEVELANYFAAALLMPYEAFSAPRNRPAMILTGNGRNCGFRWNRPPSAATLQRDGRRGVPFFRIDKAMSQSALTPLFPLPNMAAPARSGMSIRPSAPLA